MFVFISTLFTLLFNNQKAKINPYRAYEYAPDIMDSRKTSANFRSAAYAGDISPLNPIPYLSNNPDRKRLYIGIWGPSKVHNTQGQYRLINEKYNLNEHPRLQDGFRIPRGKKSYRRMNLNWPQ